MEQGTVQYVLNKKPCKTKFILHSAYRDPRRHKIDLVQDKHKVFMCLLLAQELLNVRRPRAKWIACVQHLNNNVR